MLRRIASEPPIEQVGDDVLLAVASRWGAVEGSPFENLSVLWDPSSMEESKKHEIPFWLGGESGQRKRYRPASGGHPSGDNLFRRKGANERGLDAEPSCFGTATKSKKAARGENGKRMKPSLERALLEG